VASAARPRPGDQALILALVSGILLALSFPRYGHPFFAWIALTPLIVPLFEIHHSWPAFRRGRAFLLGLVAGLAYFGGTVYWTGMVVSQFRDMDPAVWDRFVAVNLYGVLNCSRAVIDGMCERGWGRVITISSGAGVIGMRMGISIYAAAKSGSIGFMRHLAMEVARQGVTANTLALGLMGVQELTDLTRDTARQIPVGRLGSPDDVGAACAYLASEEAAWMTGQTINLNGGATTT